MNETIFLVGVEDPRNGRGYISAYANGGSFTVINDVNLARVFYTQEDAERFCVQVNNIAKFDENFKLRYDVFKYEKTVTKIETDVE